MAKKDVAVVEDQFPTEVPDYMKQGEGRGHENVGIEDLTIPRMDVIQALSPQRKSNNPKYIEGAEEGMIFNTISGKLYGDKVFFVPVFFKKEFVIWKKQDAGGGFYGAFNTRAEAERAANEQGLNFSDEGEYEILDTGQHFGLILDPATTADSPVVEEIVISMSKSKMKVSRQLNTLCKMAGGDRFSRVYEIKAVEEQNKQNQDYWNMAVKQLGFVPEPVYHIAEELYGMVSEGQRTIAREEPTPEGKKPEYA